MSKPMMVGTQEHIGVSTATNGPGGIPSVSLVSSAPNIVSIGQATRSCCNTGGGGACQTLAPTDECTPNQTMTLDITVNALAAGTSNLTLVSSDGSTFDGVVLTVDEPVGLAVTCSNAPMPTLLATTQSCVLAWDATDAHGDALMATTGVTFTSSNANVVAFDAEVTVGQQQPVSTVEASQAFLSGSRLVATGAGDGVVTAAARQAKLVAPIHVTP